jgi:hypothetical protein
MITVLVPLTPAPLLVVVFTKPSTVMTAMPAQLMDALPPLAAHTLMLHAMTTTLARLTRVTPKLVALTSKSLATMEMLALMIHAML